MYKGENKNCTKTVLPKSEIYYNISTEIRLFTNLFMAHTGMVKTF
jgi:hypothetical protein